MQIKFPPFLNFHIDFANLKCYNKHGFMKNVERQLDYEDFCMYEAGSGHHEGGY